MTTRTRRFRLILHPRGNELLTWMIQKKIYHDFFDLYGCFCRQQLAPSALSTLGSRWRQRFSWNSGRETKGEGQQLSYQYALCEMRVCVKAKAWWRRHPFTDRNIGLALSLPPNFCVRHEMSYWWTVVHHPALLLFSYLSTLISCLYVETSGKISYVVYCLYFLFLLHLLFSFLLLSFFTLRTRFFVSAKNALSCLIVDR